MLHVVRRSQGAEQEGKADDVEPENSLFHVHLQYSSSMAEYLIADFDSSIQQTLDACAAAVGGVVVIPAGVWNTGPLQLGSHTTLRVQQGAEIRFDPDFSLYRPVQTRWEGVACWGMAPLIFGRDLTDVSIEGEGLINGNGGPWWGEVRRRRAEGRLTPESDLEKELAGLNPDYRTQGSGGGGREMQFLRPPLIQFIGCTNVRIQGVTCADPPCWNTHLVYCSGVEIEGVSFRSPPDAPNTDGLDIESCRDVRISGCRFDVGDDCLALKSGSGIEGVRAGIPTEGVTVRNCVMEHGHGAVVIGSETAGGVRDVSVSECVFRGTDRGVRIKTRRGRGGTLEQLRFSDLTMEDVLAPFVINMFYRCGIRPDETDLLSPEPQPVEATTPRIADVEITRIRATGVRAAAGYVCGLPEAPITGLTIRDIQVELVAHSDVSPQEAAMSQGPPAPLDRGIYVRWAQDPVMEKIVVR